MLNNDFERASTLLTEALALARLHCDEAIVARILNDLGRVSIALQDWPTAWKLISESLPLQQKLNNGERVSSCLNNLALVARYQGKYETARSLLREGIRLRDQQHGAATPVNILNLGVVERLDHHYAESLGMIGEAADETLVSGETRVMAWCVKEMGHLAVDLRLYSIGMQLLSCAERMREEIGMSFKPFGPQDIERDRAAAFQHLGEMGAEANWALGSAAHPMQLLAEARVAIGDYLQKNNPHLPQREEL
jgi:tetratricopeptide (TPR) repeat protein